MQGVSQAEVLAHEGLAAFALSEKVTGLNNLLGTKQLSIFTTATGSLVYKVLQVSASEAK